MEINRNQVLVFDESETSLNFKEHKLFFEKFFELRTNYILASNMLFSDLTSKNVGLVIGSLLSLIDWTTSHLEKKVKVKDLKERIVTLSRSKDLIKIYQGLDEVFKQISKAHEECELLPKVIVSEEDSKIKFWREEETMSLKELKKAWYDMFLLEED